MESEIIEVRCEESGRTLKIWYKMKYKDGSKKELGPYTISNC